MGAALSNNVVMSVLEEVLSSAVMNAKSVPVAAASRMCSPVTGPCIPVSKDEEWVEDMLMTIQSSCDAYSKSNCLPTSRWT